MESHNIIQLPLLNGTTICFSRTKIDKFYNVREKTKLSWHFKSSFPWIFSTTKHYTTFKCQDVFQTMTCNEDSYYEVNLSLNTFLDLFGVSYKSADTILLEDTIKYG